VRFNSLDAAADAQVEKVSHELRPGNGSPVYRGFERQRARAVDCCFAINLIISAVKEWQTC
jgi:hypothetical protein